MVARINIPVGTKFGRLTTIEPNTKPKVACRCECGNVKSYFYHSLRRGVTRSCGCLRREVSAAKVYKHGLRRTPEYRTWTNMKTRCFNQRVKDYPNYGGRGITVCDRWRDSFENFLADMGPRPSSNHSIDRINNDGPYSPENCRWVLRETQVANRRVSSTTRISKEQWGEAQRRLRNGESARVLASELGIHFSTVYRMLKRQREKNVSLYGV